MKLSLLIEADQPAGLYRIFTKTGGSWESIARYPKFGTYMSQLGLKEPQFIDGQFWFTDKGYNDVGIHLVRKFGIDGNVKLNKPMRNFDGEAIFIRWRPKSDFKDREVYYSDQDQISFAWKRSFEGEESPADYSKLKHAMDEDHSSSNSILHPASP